MSSFWKDQSGQFAITFAMVATLMTMAVAVGIDMNGVAQQKRKMQDLADSASLAAAKSLLTGQSELLAIAQEFVAENNNTGTPVAVNLVIRRGFIRVELDADYRTEMLDILGISKVDIALHAESPMANSDPINVALVLDTTGSMAGDIGTLKQAAKGLIDTLERVDNTEIMISVVPFARYVGLPLGNRNAAWLDVPPAYLEHRPAMCSGVDEERTCYTPPPYVWEWKGAVGSREGGDNSKAMFGGSKMRGFLERRDQGTKASVSLLPLTKNFNAVRSKINSLTTGGNTYIPAGLVWGWRTVASSAPFSEAASNQGSSSLGTNAVNAVVLMTDGRNTASISSPFNPLKQGNHQNGDTTAANTVTAEICAGMKAEGIKVYTIAYRFSSADTSTRRILEDCATADDNFIEARNSAQLKDAFHRIAVSLYTSRISS